MRRRGRSSRAWSSTAAEHVERDAKGHLSFVYDADPDLAFYEPDFRPRMRVMRLCEGTAAADGEGGENVRKALQNRTLATVSACMDHII